MAARAQRLREEAADVEELPDDYPRIGAMLEHLTESAAQSLQADLGRWGVE